jgi:hypothetical protein
MQLSQLVGVGARWVAGGAAGYVYFDEDGANADTTLASLGPYWNLISSEGGNVGVAAASDFGVQYQRFDDTGAAVTGTRGLAQQSPVGLALASNAGDTLIVWAFNTRLYGRGVGTDGLIAGDVFDVANGAFSTYVWLAAAARSGEIGVAWSGDATLGNHELFFVRANTTATIGPPRAIHQTAEPHIVVDMVATSLGYVILAAGPAPDYLPTLVAVDAEGEVLQITTLPSARFAHGLAANGDRIAVVTGTTDGKPQVRAFDPALEPVGPWECVDTAYDESMPPSVAVDGAGFATIHTTSTGAVILHRLGALDAGANP